MKMDLAAIRQQFLASRLPELAPSVAWLMKRGVRSRRLGILFGTTKEHIRVLAHRARQTRPEDIRILPNDFDLASDPPAWRLKQLRAAIKARTNERDYTSPDQKIEWLENEIASCTGTYRQQYRFSEGVKGLGALLPQRGYPQDTRLLGLTGRIYLQMAWFHVHSGFSRSANDEAHRAIEYSKLAYWESKGNGGEKVYAQQIVDAALLSAQAFLLGRQTEFAWNMLELAEHASEASGTPLSSDFFRQRAVALANEESIETARKWLKRCADIRAREATKEADIILTQRYQRLMDLDWENAPQLIEAADRDYGKTTLEHYIGVNWAAACGIAVGSPSAQREALQMLERNFQTTIRFGHQATVTALLSLTGDLNLNSEFRRDWVRWTLQENAFREY